MYNIEVDGDHCYRVGRQGLLVHNASVPLATHDAKFPDEYRQRINRCNTALYFEGTKQRVLQIASGENVVQGALSEDVEIQPNGQPALWVRIGEPLGQYLPTGQAFDAVIAINARNAKMADTSYLWIFEIAGPVMKSGALITIVGESLNQRSIVWVTQNEDAIRGRGFSKVAPQAAGQVADGPANIRAMRGSALDVRGKMREYPMTGAVQVIWKKT